MIVNWQSRRQQKKLTWTKNQQAWFWLQNLNMTKTPSQNTEEKFQWPPKNKVNSCSHISERLSEKSQYSGKDGKWWWSSGSSSMTQKQNIIVVSFCHEAWVKRMLCNRVGRLYSCASWPAPVRSHSTELNSHMLPSLPYSRVRWLRWDSHWLNSKMQQHCTALN
jgi:hypothetical protein